MKLSHNRGPVSQGLASHGFGSLATSVSVQALAIPTGVILARTLGPAGRGDLAAILLWPALIATFAEFGVGDAVTYFAARRLAPPSKIVVTGLAVMGCLTALAMATGYLIIPSVLRQHGQEVVGIALLYLAFIPLYMIANLFLRILLGMREIPAYNRIRLLLPVCTFLGLATLALFRVHGIRTIVLTYMGAYSLIALSSAWAILQRDWLRVERPSVRTAGEMLSYGWRAHIGTISWSANERADLVLISIFLPAVALGFYSIAVTLTAGVILIGSTIGMIALSVVANLPESERLALLAKLVRFTLALSLIAALLFALISPLVIGIFFGSPFLPAVPIGQVLLLSSASLGVSRVVSAGLKATNHPLDAGLGELVGTVVTLISLAILLPTLGIMGAAIASGLAYTASLAYMIWRISRLGVTPRSMLLLTKTDLSTARGLVSARLGSLRSRLGS